MTCIETRHTVTGHHGRVLVGVAVRKVGPALQSKTLFSAESSLSPEEARRAAQAIRDPNGSFRSEDRAFAVWCMEYEGDLLDWTSESGKGIVETFRLGADVWSDAFVQAIEDEAREAEGSRWSPSTTRGRPSPRGGRPPRRLRRRSPAGPLSTPTDSRCIAPSAGWRRTGRRRGRARGRTPSGGASDG